MTNSQQRRFSSHRKKFISVISLFILLSACALLFQNCGEGYEIKTSKITPPDLPGDTPNTDPTIDPLLLDQDADGFMAKDDCDDRNSDIHLTQNFYKDDDGDGAGSILKSARICGVNAIGYSTNSSDCDDTNSEIINPKPYFKDTDNDGFGGSESSLHCSASAPMGFKSNSGDPNDADQNITPLDTDGDSVADSADCAPADASAYQLVTYYSDNDRDDKGDPNSSQAFCVANPVPQKVNYSLIANDTCPSVYNYNRNLDGDTLDDACDNEIVSSSLVVRSSLSISQETNALGNRVLYRFGTIRVENGGRLYIETNIEVTQQLFVGVTEWVDPEQFSTAEPILFLNGKAELSAIGESVYLTISGGALVGTQRVTSTPYLISNFRNILVSTAAHIKPNSIDNVTNSYAPRLDLFNVKIRGLKDANGGLVLRYDPKSLFYNFDRAIISESVGYPVNATIDTREASATTLTPYSTVLTNLASYIRYENNLYNGPKLSIFHKEGILSITDPKIFTGQQGTTEVYLDVLVLEGGTLIFNGMKRVRGTRTIQNTTSFYIMSRGESIEFNGCRSVENLGFDIFTNSKVTSSNSKLSGVLFKMSSSGNKNPVQIVNSQIEYPTGSKVFRYKSSSGEIRRIGIDYFGLGKPVLIQFKTTVNLHPTMSGLILRNNDSLGSDCGATTYTDQLWKFESPAMCIESSVTINDESKLLLLRNADFQPDGLDTL